MDDFKIGQTNPQTPISGAVINITELDITAALGGKNVLLVLPYGLQINEPSTPIMSVTGKFVSQGDNQFTFVTDTLNRDSQKYNGLPLAAGEVSIGIPALKTRLHFLTDGTLEFISNGTAGSAGTPDYLVKYNELLTAFNQLKNDFNALVTTFNAHVHPGITSGPSSSLITVTPGSVSVASMTSAKLSTFKVPNV